jgi:hypothetical protein
MAQIKSISIEYGRTFNIGNYESIRLGLTVSKDIIEGDNVTEEVQKSMNGLKALVHKEAARIIEARKEERSTGN